MYQYISASWIIIPIYLCIYVIFLFEINIYIQSYPLEKYEKQIFIIYCFFFLLILLLKMSWLNESRIEWNSPTCQLELELYRQTCDVGIAHRSIFDPRRKAERLTKGSRGHDRSPCDDYTARTRRQRGHGHVVLRLFELLRIST